MSDPNISIIIPVYNSEDDLERCLDSVLAQSHQKIEVVVVDDGSTDRSGEILDRYAKADGRVRVIHQNNGGRSSARNTGIREATCPYIMFVDSDDFVNSRFCELAYNTIVNEHADIVCFGFTKVSNKGRDQFVTYSENRELSQEQGMKLLIDDSYAWDKIYRSELFRGIRYPVGKDYEDIFTLYRVLDKATRVYFLARPDLYYYTDQDISITSSKSATAIKDQFEASLSQYDFFQSNYPRVADTMLPEILIRSIRYCTYCPKNYDLRLYQRAHDLLKDHQVPDSFDRAHRFLMRLYQLAEPLAQLAFMVKRAGRSNS